MFDSIDEEQQSLLVVDTAPETNEDLVTVVNAIEVPEIVHTGCIGKFFPFGFWYEFKMLLKLAFPITITTLINFISGPISLIFCGQLGKDALATVGLAVSLFNVTGFAVITGLLSAADTLFSQTFGSNAKYRMGEQLQRTCVIVTLCCFPCVTLLVLAEPILVALKQNPAVAKSAATYLYYLSPGIFFVAYGQTFTKYVQVQNHVYPPMIIGLIGNGINALMHYILLFVVQYGVIGSAIAQSVSYFIQALMLLCFIIFLECAKEGVYWNGWTNNLWLEWGVWFKMALPGVVMTTLEWTIFEIGSFVAGSLGKEELGTQSILFNIESICYTLLPLGFGIATSIRVGQFLGAKSAVGPRSVISTALVTLWMTSIIFITVIVSLRWQLPRIFSSDQVVIRMTAELLPIIAAFQIFDGTVGVCSGAVRGAGLQNAGAINCFVTLYLIGAPIGLCLVFVAKYGLKGLWAGLTLGTIAEALVYLAITQCINWERQVVLAAKRIHDASDQETALSSGSLSIDMLPDATESDTKDSPPDDKMGASVTLGSQPGRGGCSILVLKRSALILTVLLLFAIGVCCRTLVPWSDVFGTFCIFSNETFIALRADVARNIPNCTFVTI